MGIKATVLTLKNEYMNEKGKTSVCLTRTSLQHKTINRGETASTNKIDQGKRGKG